MTLIYFYSGAYERYETLLCTHLTQSAREEAAMSLLSAFVHKLKKNQQQPTHK